MIYTFTFKDILVTINTAVPVGEGSDEICTVSYIAPDHTNVVTVAEMGDFTRKKGQSQIIVDRWCYLADNGVALKTTRKKLPVLSFTNNETNKLGIGYYTAFNGMATGTTAMGTIADLAIINTHLESNEIVEIFGEKIPCFNPLNGWAFYEPIQVAAVIDNETMAGQNDGRILVNIVRPTTGSFETKITRTFDDVVIQDWNTNLLITGLAPGNYIVEVRSTSDNTILANTKLVTVNQGV